MVVKVPPFLGRLASRIFKIPSKLCFWRKSMVLLTNFCLFFLSFAIPLYFVLPSFQPPMAIITWGARLENNRLDAKVLSISRWHLWAVFWNCFGLYSVQVVKTSLHFCIFVLDFIPLKWGLIVFFFLNSPSSAARSSWGRWPSWSRPGRSPSPGPSMCPGTWLKISQRRDRQSFEGKWLGTLFHAKQHHEIFS